MSRHKHQATDDRRRQVLALMGFGLRQEDVSKLLRMDLKTLRKYYRHELDTGALQANAKVAKSLFHMATRDKVTSARNLLG